MKEETSVERIDRKSKENVAKQKAAADAKAAARDKSTAAFQAHKKDVLSKGGRPVDALDSWQKKKLNNSAVDPYDTVKDYLLETGHAETVAEASYIISVMDEDAINNIVGLKD